MGKHLLDLFHERLVSGLRVRVLAGRLAGLLPRDSMVLDVGSGDGRIARCLMDMRPDLTINGIDVAARPSAQIPVRSFDGKFIPLGSDSVDVAMLIDVLHHTERPVELLREAVRVARRLVLIKDHLLAGFLSRGTLRFMDRVGNRRHGVALPYTYLTRRQWDDIFEQTGLTIDFWEGKLKLYPFPASLVFDRSLHFMARMRTHKPSKVLA